MAAIFFISSAQPVLTPINNIIIDAIELAQTNDVHILCLPAHTTHILKLLDTGLNHSCHSSMQLVSRKTSKMLSLYKLLHFTTLINLKMQCVPTESR